jgi:hypothetical protein
MATTRKVDPLEYELQQERAAALGRTGKRVEQTIAALEAGAGVEDELLDHAASAVWHYMIVRDALGFHDHAAVLALYRVPPRVMARVGVVRK